MMCISANKQRGQAAIMAVMFFVLISVVIVGSMSFLVFSRLRGAEELVLSKKVYATSESGVEDIGYRMVHMKKPFDAVIPPPPAPTQTIVTTVNGGTASLVYGGPDAVTGFYSLNTAGSQVQNRYRKLNASVKLESCKGVAFEQGIQTGFLGFRFDSNFSLKHQDEVNNPASAERGDIFSNGHVLDWDNGVNMWVSGKVTLSQPTTLNAGDPLYDTLSTPQAIKDYMQTAYSDSQAGLVPVTIADISGRADVAQSFIAPMTGFVTRVEVYGSVTAPYNKSVSVRIIPTDYGVAGVDRPNPIMNPRSQALTTSGFNTGGWGASPSWRTVDLTTKIPVIQNEKYWLVLDSSVDTGGSYSLYTGNPSSPTAYTPNNTCYGSVYCTSIVWPDPNIAGEGALDYAGRFLQTSDSNASDPTWTAHGSTPSGGDIAFRMYFGAEGQLYVNQPTRDYMPTVRRAVTGGDITAFFNEDSRTAGKITRSADLIDTYLSYAATTTNGTSPGAGAQQCSTNQSSSACVLQSLKTAYPLPAKLGVESDAEHTWEEAVYDMKKTAKALGSRSATSTMTIYDDSPRVGVYIAPHTDNGNVTIADDTEVYLLGEIPSGVTLPCNAFESCLYQIPSGQPYSALYQPGYLYTANNTYPGITMPKCPANPTGEPCFIWYIKGDLFLPDSCLVKTYPPNKKAFIVVDGSVRIGNGGAQICNFDSDGGIYIVSLKKDITTNNTAAPDKTINLLGNVGGDLVLFAPLGEINLNRKVDAIALSAPRITVSNGAAIRYQSGAGEGASPSNAQNSLRFKSYYEGE